MRSSFLEAKQLLLQLLQSNFDVVESFRAQLTALDDPDVHRALNNRGLELASIIRAMQPDVGSGVGSFGGHWYTCPNNHVYTIGECGGAMETSSCPECGEVIGGSNHHLTQGNHVAIDFLRQAGQAHLVPANDAYW